MSFWPKEITFSEIWINSLGSFIAGLIWSILIVVITFMLGDIINVAADLKNSWNWFETNAIFPLALSFVTLIGTTVTVILTYIMLNLTNSERYKRNIVIFSQIAFFIVLSYIFFAPVYVYVWLENYNNTLYIFLIHVLTLSFWTSLILEILNNYRYILTGFYGSFIALFITSIISFSIFLSFDSWTAKLIALTLLLPLINFLITFFKQLFEFMYFHYYKYTNNDGLWDIFYQIEMEEKEALLEEEEKNSI